MSLYLYALLDEKTYLVKIGCTKSIETRRKALQSHYHTRLSLVCHVFVGDFGFQIEHRIHKLLAAQHMTGEWFAIALTQAMLNDLVAQALLMKPFAHLSLPWRPVWDDPRLELRFP